MVFQVTHTYEQDADELFEVLTDFESVRAKYLAMGHQDVQLVDRTDHPDGAVTLVTRRLVPLQLPGFAKRVLSPRQTVVQTDTWTAPDAHRVRTGTFRVESSSAPVKVGGTMRLAPRGRRGCTNITTVDVECKVPLIGHKIAEYVGATTRDAVDHEQIWLREHLSSHC